MTSCASRDHSPSNSKSGDVRQESTAYLGASHAFSLGAPVKPLPKTYVRSNGALAAAASAGVGNRRQAAQLAEGATSYGQKKEGPFTKTPRRSDISETVGSSREQSPSYAAALHATKSPASAQKPLSSTPNSRRPSPLQGFKGNGVDTPAKTSRFTDDAAAVGATSSLVSLFESKQNPKKDVPITHSVRYVTKPTSIVASPTPIKPPIKPRSSTTDSPITLPLASELEKGFRASGTSKILNPDATAAIARSIGGARAATTRSSKAVHSTALARTVPEAPAPHQSRAHAAPLNLAQPAEPSTALQIPRPDPAFPPSKLSSAQGSRPLLPVRSSRSFETKVDSLANTIVAASLASSRAPSPTKLPPPPPRRHKSHSLFHNQHGQGQVSRIPSPAKAMRQTMREQLPSDDEVEYKKRSILGRKHPHKHHEGDRKRYRAIVTERERRRYDGVWAANKGLRMDADSSDSVLNLVVRDIWSRSRLPNNVLADIWNLVDTKGRDRLERNEFVVGMWLIDQQLKGRKLPNMVSDSLWNSVRLLHGVKVSRHQH